MIKSKNFILLSKDIILRIKKQIFLVISILCLIFLLAWTFVPIDKKYIVQGFVWERSITVEEYTLYHESGWSIPTGSTVTSSRKEIHHYESVFDYYQCINEHLIYEVDSIKDFIGINKKKGKRKSYRESKLEKMKRVCRICYLEEDENNLENPLVQPCECTGSVKFIHLECLRKWVSTRSCVKIDTTSECCIFLIKPVECELCKAKFPDFIKYEKRLLPVIDFSQVFDNYLTLESLTLDRQNNKFIYVISLNKERKIKIGRGHEAKVILSDISVSRIHCIMTVEKNQVFIEDNESKFGTLILVQCPNIKLSENLPLYIQVGRTFFNCQLSKPFHLFNCCGIEEKNNIYYYYN